MTVSQQDDGNRLPFNFSWVNAELAGSGHLGHQPEQLAEALAALKGEGIGCIVSLAPLDGAAVAAAGLTPIQLNVPDMGVPALRDLAAAVAAALARLKEGKKILVHCGAGYGRTGLFLACLLVSQGMTAEEAISLVRRQRPGSIETSGQEELVRVWEERERTPE